MSIVINSIYLESMILNSWFPPSNITKNRRECVIIDFQIIIQEAIWAEKKR